MFLCLRLLVHHPALHVAMVVWVHVIHKTGVYLWPSGEEGSGNEHTHTVSQSVSRCLGRPVRKGSSSERVLSSPRAKAMVDSFLMEFSRSCRDRETLASLAT